MSGVLRRILVPTDGSESSLAATELAMKLAQGHGAELVFVHCINYAAIVAQTTTAYGYNGASELLEAFEQQAQSVIAEGKNAAAARFIKATGCTLEGRADEAIVQYAGEQHVDAIVMGTRGHTGLERTFLGSTAEGVLRLASVPVFVVHAAPEGERATDAQTFANIIVAVDDSEASAAAASFAASLAASGDKSLVLCNVVENSKIVRERSDYHGDVERLLVSQKAEGSLLLTRIKDNASNAGATTIERIVVVGDPVEEILEAARGKHAGLIAIGTHGRRGLSRMIMGSIAEGLVRSSPIPVVVVRVPSARARGTIHAVSAVGGGQRPS